MQEFLRGMLLNVFTWSTAPSSVHAVETQLNNVNSVQQMAHYSTAYSYMSSELVLNEPAKTRATLTPINLENTTVGAIQRKVVY